MPLPLQAALVVKTGVIQDAQANANLWAGTSNLELLAALNVKAGTVGIEFVQTVTTLNTTLTLGAETERLR